MSLDPWKTVDRFDLEREVRILCEDPAGGVLVARGDDNSGRWVAADFVAARCEHFGFPPVVVRAMAGRPAFLTDMLGDAWRAVDTPVSATQVPRSVSHPRYMSGAEIVSEIGACCTLNGSPRAFIFDTVDPDGPLSRSQFGHFADLARIAQCPVVVLVRAESKSTVPRHVKTLELGAMPLMEVSSSMFTSAEFADFHEQRLRDLFDEVASLADSDDNVLAVEAYDVLEAGLRGIERP